MTYGCCFASLPLITPVRLLFIGDVKLKFIVVTLIVSYLHCHGDGLWSLCAFGDVFGFVYAWQLRKEMISLFL